MVCLPSVVRYQPDSNSPTSLGRVQSLESCAHAFRSATVAVVKQEVSAI